MSRLSQLPGLVLVATTIVLSSAWSGEKDSDFQKNIRTSLDESCYLIEHFPGAKYHLKLEERIEEDLMDEQWLCGLDYKDTSKKSSIAVCPKLKGLSPALNFFETPEHLSKKILEENLCEVKNLKLEKLAKFKVSEPSGCSSTASILGYYHLSRILGDLLHVPVSVAKTMDVEYFKKNVDVALLATKEKSKTTFNTWNKVSKSVSLSSDPNKKSRLLTKDEKLVFGAMSKVMKKEKTYHEFDVASRVRIWEQFKNSNSYYKLLTMNQPLHEMIPNQFTNENVQKLVAMRDTSNMLLMDYLMSQHDRLDNISYKEKYYWKETLNKGESKIRRDKPSKLSAKSIKKLNPLLIKEMALKDNDCGVSFSNDVKDNKLLHSISHMDPKVYKRLQWLRSILNEKETQNYFQDKLLFSSSEWKQFQKNVVEAAELFEEKCKKEELRLDLDLGYFAGEDVKNTIQDCSAIKDYADRKADIKEIKKQ